MDRTAGVTVVWNSQRDHTSTFQPTCTLRPPGARIDVKTVDLRNGDDAAASIGGSHRPYIRSVLLQREMRPGFMIVGQKQSDPPI